MMPVSAEQAAEYERDAIEQERRDRRERIATAVLAGMVAHSANGSMEWFVSNALNMADHLIAALDAAPADGD